MSEKDKQELLSCILSGLKENQNLDICLPGASCRTGTKVTSPVHILVVGASNSTRLATALEGLGITIGRVSTTNWKPSKESVEILAAHVKSSVEGEKPTVVVFHMHDNLHTPSRPSRTRRGTSPWRGSWSWLPRTSS